MPQPDAVFPGDVTTSPTFAAAMAKLVNGPFVGSRKYQEQQGRADRMGMHPDLRRFETAFQGRLVKLKIPMFSAEVVRSAARQNEMFHLGHSKAKGGESAHQFGCAFDLVHSVHAWALDAKAWALIGHVGHEVAKSLGIEVTWGGDDGPGDDFAWDPAHWQLKHWKALKGGYPVWPQKPPNGV